MSRLSRQDSDLHNEDGTHRSTPATTSGDALERYEARIRRHLEAHELEDGGWVDFQSQVSIEEE
jgi:hypothetical protein